MSEPVFVDKEVASIEGVGISCVGGGMSVEAMIFDVENVVDNGVGSFVSASMENVLTEGISDLLASDDVKIFKDLLIVPTSTTMLRLDVDKEDVVVLDLIVVMTASALDEISVAGRDANI